MSHVSSESIVLSRSPASAVLEPAGDLSPVARTLQVRRFIDAFRQHGHRQASLDPLHLAAVPEVPELDPVFHGLEPAQPIGAENPLLPPSAAVHELERQLRRVYCGAIGLDLSGIRDPQRRAQLSAWLKAEQLAPLPARGERRRLLRRLVAAEMWERHVAASFEHAKRFSLEGCESLVPLVEAIVDQAAAQGVRQVFAGMPHRGRLNMLVNVMGVDPATLLACLDPDSEAAAVQRDLPYHLGGNTVKQTPDGDVAIFLAPNPSHLQSVYPVVSGMARAYQDEHRGFGCLPLVVHGDAAFAGQGIVMETLNMTRKDGYALGGTVHVIVNNQIGFTTPNRMDAEAQSYCTDIARMIDAPVIRVNADRPDEVMRAAKLALRYRMEHEADIVIDLIGYRRLGHSEHDIPALTQPFQQAAIATHPTVTELYHAAIGEETPLEALRAEALQHLQSPSAQTLSRPRADRTPPTKRNKRTKRTRPLSLARVQSLTAALIRTPPEVQPHDFVRNVTAKWQKSVADESAAVDWCFAENLAYATLLDDGHSVRISGMDVGRGTFMHRHAVWHSQGGAAPAVEPYVPLQNLGVHQGEFDIVNSPLTEEAVLGFEYGYSVQTGSRLVIWEAQFGDFVNGAQVIIDQYIAAGEYKWDQPSGLTMLLPHGHEGVGPEHSTGYVSRFLQLCAGGNMKVVMPSTSAQWFHLLREQALSAEPKPLVVMSPKGQLYGNMRSHAPLGELIGGAFAPVLHDSGVASPDDVTRVVLSSGKFYYDLLAARDASGDTRTALVRVEQLYPFPTGELAVALAAFPKLTEVVWAQEEEKNHGAWHFVRDHLQQAAPANCRIVDVCRRESPSGAHSSIRAHRDEQRRLVAAALTRA
ncbi:2-oxoglutarate dehydrogenase E1 component [Paraburkholderia phenoliruptrix]|uniref:oxoglutarate dehydrogenase (succinyl-transferring) n=3 Tax=Burkholderiales TaxID=80840 RepID=K0DQH1_9BURK|nr:2-oxoglutarate dehydrogenase E1 component [Paraburkholderia phenoliruptrix]AFT88386.1 2-oxoglutarate dehydrogenase E1 component [Paraburkholderia phenoliruptrix BR3459a]MDR6418644.1 2-oxoglutarate dehydrogenase E1 component [Paraburkholderia phenoliruptrix]CAB4047312.1 2-oxoglutarate dehydrogenase E1 component [Paraburkholderia phenoliruptrix]